MVNYSDSIGLKPPANTVSSRRLYLSQEWGEKWDDIPFTSIGSWHAFDSKRLRCCVSPNEVSGGAAKRFHCIQAMPSHFQIPRPFVGTCCGNSGAEPGSRGYFANEGDFRPTHPTLATARATNFAGTSVLEVPYKMRVRKAI